MWIITEDVLFPCHENTTWFVYKTDDCPIDLTKPIDLDEVRALMPYKFRLMGDDGDVAYIGYCSTLNLTDEWGREILSPLDWAGPHVGCTIMQQFVETKTVSVQVDIWETIYG
ncbi:MAG: hypothetical protein PHR28_12100 [candidate division Zixibacteria bacterium]|jgi:hypothetical protein|nr:hypothetical protein [candidate division Zixibacteria bacterium]